MQRKTLESYHLKNHAASRLVNLMLEPFDELIELDMNRMSIQNLRHANGKYFVPIFDESMPDIRRYSAENMVHPADQELYLRITDPDTLAEQMENSPTPASATSCSTAAGAGSSRSASTPSPTACRRASTTPLCSTSKTRWRSRRRTIPPPTAAR